ncbi:hypothetical protein DOTSEDRAFT_52125 [Dothistroma septosporum NZE10]|uniref:F-box domain-containing protein n=1 Tax=Dothistroma septosporum (strain NZE10 / CBS 128990) TaxID=675120 RepID=N1PTK6_DOTSN|nr:hypothetical protein DOTSEDRAFT_52125 [Dothistroma septosporum NZE10]
MSILQPTAATLSAPKYPQPHSPLFTLPTELRLQIYTHLLTLHPSIYSTNDTCLNAVSIIWSSRPSAYLQILATCQTIYNEAADLFYSLNRLYITNRQTANISHLDSFFGTVRAERLKGVREVVLAVGIFEDVMKGWRLVRDVMPKLEVLEFVIRVAFDLVEDAEKGRGEFLREFGVRKGDGGREDMGPKLRELRLTHKWASQLSPVDLWHWRKFGEQMDQMLPFKVITDRP